MKSLTFNGIKKPWLYLLQGRYKPPFAPIQRDLIYVTGMDGAYLGNTNLRPLYINQPVGFVVKNDEHALQLKDELADWLITNEPVPLQFDDEPGRTYYAVVQNTIEDFERFVNLRQGTIQFLCLDPYSYGEEQTIEFQSDSVIIENKGTADTEPIFELTAKEPTTFAMVSNGDEYMMVGRPVDVDELAQPRFTTILNDNCSSLVGWTALPNGAQLDTGIVGGTMYVHGGYGFSAESYGTNPNGWVGPAIRRSLSETIQNFRVEMRILANNTSGDVGSLELHLLDENDNVIAIMAMRDSTAKVAENRAVIQLGQAGNRHSFLNYNGGYRSTWNDFSGIIRLEREGTEFRGYVAMLEDGRHIRRHTVQPFHDTLGNYQGKLASIVVYDAKAKEYTSYLKVMNHITVQRINEQVEVPYIVDDGDIIEFNHQTRDAYINGEPVPFDFGADFFTLKKGFNSLVVLPENTFDTTIRFREKYR